MNAPADDAEVAGGVETSDASDASSNVSGDGETDLDLRQAVLAIKGSAQDITAMVEAVRSIADTTNPLALTAHIESARPGGLCRLGSG